MESELPPKPADLDPAKPKSPHPGIEPLLVDFVGLARLLSRSVTSLYRDRAAGRLGVEPVKLCGSVRFRVDEVREWVAAGCPPREPWRAIRAAQQRGRG
jgi:hypothetical protein